MRELAVFLIEAHQTVNRGKLFVACLETLFCCRILAERGQRDNDLCSAFCTQFIVGVGERAGCVILLQNQVADCRIDCILYVRVCLVIRSESLNCHRSHVDVGRRAVCRPAALSLRVQNFLNQIIPDRRVAGDSVLLAVDCEKRKDGTCDALLNRPVEVTVAL